MKVRAHGDRPLSPGKRTQKESPAETVRFPVQFTDTFVKESGRWRFFRQTFRGFAFFPAEHKSPCALPRRTWLGVLA